MTLIHIFQCIDFIYHDNKRNDIITLKYNNDDNSLYSLLTSYSKENNNNGYITLWYKKKKKIKLKDIEWK